MMTDRAERVSRDDAGGASPIAVLERWLLALEGNQGLDRIGPDADLIEEGLIDSMEFVNFLLVIEDLRGGQIPADRIRADAFRTLRTITRSFLEPVEDGGGGPT